MMTKIRFTLPASNIIGADGCVLLGEFNNWDLDEGVFLQKQDDGSMTAEVDLPAGNDFQYRYLLSNGRWVNDNSEKVVAEMHGFPVENCIVRVPQQTEVKKLIKAKTVKAKPAKASKSRPVVVKEALIKIEGIGKKIEALLYKQEIYTYKQLSKTTVKKLKQILEHAGNKYSMHNPGSWPRQAKLAADAKWKELEELQSQLKAGK